MSIMYKILLTLMIKLSKRANETGEDWRKLVDVNIEGYYEDMDALNILELMIIHVVPIMLMT